MHNIWSEIAGSGFYFLAAVSMSLNDPWSSMWSKLAWLRLNGRLLCSRRTSVASDRGRGEWHWIPWSDSISASSPWVLRNSPLWNPSPGNNARSTTFLFMSTCAVGCLSAVVGLHLNFDDLSGHAKVGLFFYWWLLLMSKCSWCSGYTMNFRLITGEMFALEKWGCCRIPP